MPMALRPNKEKKMAKQKGARANKPNDSFGTLNDESLYRGKYRGDVWKEEEEDTTNEQKTEETDSEPKIVLQGGLIDMIVTLDEIKKDIPEGKYLKMMNIMKVMNDSLKDLPEP